MSLFPLLNHESGNTREELHEQNHELDKYLQTTPDVRYAIDHTLNNGKNISDQLINIQEEIHNETSTRFNLPLHMYRLNDYMNESDRNNLETLMKNLSIDMNNHPGALKAPVINRKNTSYHLASTGNQIPLHMLGSAFMGSLGGAGVALEGTAALSCYTLAGMSAFFETGLWLNREPTRTLGEVIGAKTDLVRTYQETQDII